MNKQTIQTSAEIQIHNKKKLEKNATLDYIALFLLHYRGMLAGWQCEYYAVINLTSEQLSLGGSHVTCFAVVVLFCLITIFIFISNKWSDRDVSFFVCFWYFSLINLITFYVFMLTEWAGELQTDRVKEYTRYIRYGCKSDHILCQYSNYRFQCTNI